MVYKTSNHYYRLLVFIVGIIATLAYRIIVVLNFYSPLWVEIAWYIGTIGFIWYFAHRYRVQNHYAEVIDELDLDRKIKQGKLNQEDKQALAFVLSGIKSSKAKWNSICIFIFSALALIYAIVTNLIKWLN